jgi:hypothetical protein
MLSGNSVVCVRHSPLMKRFIRWLHQYIGGYYIKHHVLTQSRPKPASQQFPMNGWLTLKTSHSRADNG